MPSLKTLLASATRIVSDVGSSLDLPLGAKALIFLLKLTDAKTDSNDTLNIFVQHSPDGVIWNDFVSFTQILGNGSDTITLQAIVNLLVTPTTALGAPADGSLAAGTILQGPIGPLIRSKFAIVDGDADADQSFTFGLTMRVLK